MAQELQGLEFTAEPPPQQLDFRTDDPQIQALAEHLEAVVTWMESQLRRLSFISQEYAYIQLAVLHEEPDNPEDGMLVYADGTNFSPVPGKGAGFYGFAAGAWEFLGP